mmetsp:Transcript_24705/g.51373  ORF Transcript_24705/g.51373 Transcript_24705/m.51373 type:complete len:271 (+) Transcript_24705:249-1061(+)
MIWDMSPFSCKTTRMQNPGLILINSFVSGESRRKRHGSSADCLRRRHMDGAVFSVIKIRQRHQQEIQRPRQHQVPLLLLQEVQRMRQQQNRLSVPQPARRQAQRAALLGRHQALHPWHQRQWTPILHHCQCSRQFCLRFHPLRVQLLHLQRQARRPKIRNQRFLQHSNLQRQAHHPQVARLPKIQNQLFLQHSNLQRQAHHPKAERCPKMQNQLFPQHCNRRRLLRLLQRHHLPLHRQHLLRPRPHPARQHLLPLHRQHPARQAHQLREV